MTTSAPQAPVKPDVPPKRAPDLARATLTARMEERLIAPLRRNPLLARSLFLASVVAVLCVHAGIIAYLLHKDRSDPVKPLEQQETPVEVVMEVPKPPPAPPPPPQKPSAKQEIEKPATSAPRAANDEKVDTTQLDKETHAPKAPTPPTDGKPEPEKDAAAPPTPPDTPDKEQKDAGKPDDDKKEADALAKATPEKKPDPSPPKAIRPTVKKQATKSALQQLAGTSRLPDYKFARPTKKSPVSGGTEDARYLAIVYGLVMQNFHPVGVTLDGTGSVSVAFEIDSSGRVIGVGVEEGSGNPSFDAAAEEAVRRSSPLPAPPPGSPHGLIARISPVGRS